MRHSLEKLRICTSRDPRSSLAVPIISARQLLLLCAVHMSMRSLHCHFFFQPPIFLLVLFSTCCLSLLSSSVTCCMRMFEIRAFTSSKFKLEFPCPRYDEKLSCLQNVDKKSIQVFAPFNFWYHRSFYQKTLCTRNVAVVLGVVLAAVPDSAPWDGYTAEPNKRAGLDVTDSDAHIRMQRARDQAFDNEPQNEDATLTLRPPTAAVQRALFASSLLLAVLAVIWPALSKS